MHLPRSMQPAVRIALLFALLCLGFAGQGSLAQTDEAEVAGDAAPVLEGAPTLDAAARARLQAERAAFENTIVALEAQHGLYGAELSEAYVGLGQTLRASSEHEAAAEAFSKALQALRVGYGLNDLRQLPVLQELRATHEQLGRWDDVHAMNFLAFNIAARNSDEELRMRSLRDLGRWLRKAANENLVSDIAANAGNVITLYKREIRRIEDKDPYPGRNLHLASLYLDLASAELGEAQRKYKLPISEFQMPGLGEQRSTVTQNCFSGVDRNGRMITVCNEPMVIPNMNYYLGPNAQKAQEIRAHLLDVESAVLKAFNMLQDDADPSARQAELLDEMHRVTGEYNAFVQENRDHETPLR